jgi:hypothetical protein
MKALAYIIKRTIINYIKRLKEKPQKLVGPIFVVIWLAVMFLPRKSSSSNGTASTPEIFVSLFLLFIITVFLFSLYSGSKKVDSKFNMCDVNLIFVSPIRPQTVMLYGIVKKIALELITSFYLIYQIPNILRNYNVPAINQIMLVIAYILFQLVLCNIIKLFIFALSTKHETLGSTIRIIIRILIISVVGGAVLLFLKGNPLEFGKSLASHVTYDAFIKYIPVFGWMREMALQTFTGITLSYYIYIILLLALSGLIVYITYTMELDFYEDMLSSAEMNDMVKNIREGKNVSQNQNKQSILTKPFKKTKLELEGVYGAKVLFFKHMNEYMKRSFLFLINTYSLILLSVSILLGIFAKGLDIKIVFLAGCVLLFFSAGFGGKIYTEIFSYFIFLLPDSPQKKLFYGIASSLVKVFSDALLLFLPFGILAKASPFEVLLSIICYITLGGMLSYSGLLGFRIASFLGFTGAIAQSLFFMFFQLLIAVPAVIIIVILTASFTVLSAYSLYPAFLIYSVGAGALFSLGCVGLFNDMEFK